MEDLTTRVEALERRLRRWQYFALAVCSMGPVLSLQGRVSAQKDPVGTRVKAPLVIVDDRGTTLAEVRATSSGGALAIYGGGPEPVVLVGGTEAGGTVDVYNRQTKVVAGLGATAGGGGHVGVYARTGKELAGMGEDAGGDGHFSLANAEGTHLVDLFATEDGGALQLSDPVGQEQVSSYVTPTGGHLAIYNRAGSPVLRTGAVAHGGAFTLYRKGGAVAVNAEALEDKNRLALRDPEQTRDILLVAEPESSFIGTAGPNATGGVILNSRRGRGGEILVTDDQGAILFRQPAAGDQAGVPPTARLGEMVRRDLLAFNEAVQQKSFAAFYRGLHPVWQEQTTAADLLKSFQIFLDRKIDISPVGNLRPQFNPAPSLDERGVLTVTGHYPTQPSQVHFKLEYLQEDGVWKLVGVNLDVR